MRLAVPVLLATLALTGCVKRLAIDALADGLSSSSAGTFARDDDLDLVGDALPLALKLQEALHDQVPDHEGLHVALCSGFTQYAMVWVQFPAEQHKYDDYAAYRAGIARAGRLFLRARRYGLEGMDLQHPGFSSRLVEDPVAALSVMTRDDVPLLYWLGASWLAAISNARQDPEMIGQIPVAAAIVHRAAELWEDWDRGSIHELLVSLEPSLPGPGGQDRARTHFDRAVELSGASRASPYVALAASVYVDLQDRPGFEALLIQALAVAGLPEETLANQYAKEKAAWLLDHADDLFVGAEAP